MAEAFPPTAIVEAGLHEVGSLLRKRGETLSVCETAAGGLISASLLSLPGASNYFRGGVNGYSLTSRKAFAEWTDEDTKVYNGPTEQIVFNLATSVRNSLDTTWAVSESGVAGPTLSPSYRPEISAPGYCPVAVLGPKGYQRTFTFETGKTGDDDRTTNMILFAAQVVKALRESLSEIEGKSSSKS